MPPNDDDRNPDQDTAAPAQSGAGNELDENAAEHDSKNPAVEDEPTADEPGGEPMSGDDELRAGQYSPTGDHGGDD